MEGHEKKHYPLPLLSFSPYFAFGLALYAINYYIFVQSMNAIKSPYIAIASARATKIRTRPNDSGFSAVAPAAATPVDDIANPAPSADPAIAIPAAIAIHPLSVTPDTTSPCADATPTPVNSKSKQSVNANPYFEFISFLFTFFFLLIYLFICLFVYIY